MVYPEEPSIWAIPHIPALYDDDGDYGGKQTMTVNILKWKNIKNHLSMNKLVM